MAWWAYEWEAEDGNEVDIDAAARGRRFLREQVRKHPSDLGQMLADIEAMASPFYLGLDYSDDLDDIDEMGPF